MLIDIETFKKNYDGNSTKSVICNKINTWFKYAHVYDTVFALISNLS